MFQPKLAPTANNITSNITSACQASKRLNRDGCRSLRIILGFLVEYGSGNTSLSYVKCSYLRRHIKGQRPIFS